MTLWERIEQRKLLDDLENQFWQFTGKFRVEDLNPTELGYYTKIVALYEQNTQGIKDELDLL